MNEEVIRENGRVIAECPMKNENGYYTMDLEGFRQKITEKTKAVIICNPHNPAGRVWTRKEFLDFADICMEKWLDGLNAYLEENLDYFTEYVKENLPMLTVRKPEGTYLLWVDFTKVPVPDGDVHGFLKEKCGLIVNDGEFFGKEGKGFVRFNAACPRKRLEEALLRLKKGMEEFE